MSTKLKPCCSREALRQLNSSTYVDTAALLRRPLHSTQHAAGVYRNSHSHLKHQETAPLCSMYLIVAVKVEQLICMPLFIYLIVASEVKLKSWLVKNSTRVGSGLAFSIGQSRPHVRTSTINTVCKTHHHYHIIACCCKCTICKPYRQVDMEKGDYKVSQSIYWLVGRLGSLWCSSLLPLYV